MHQIKTPETDRHVKDSAMYGDVVPYHFACKLERENIVMRQVIKEAHEALDGCREDTCELAAERDWWKSEPRCGYSSRWIDMQTRIAKAEAALAKLQPFIN